MIAEKMEQIHGKWSDKGYRRIRDDLEHDFGIDVSDKRVLRICRVKESSQQLSTAVTAARAMHLVRSMWQKIS